MLRNLRRTCGAMVSCEKTSPVLVFYPSLDRCAGRSRIKVKRLSAPWFKQTARGMQWKKETIPLLTVLWSMVTRFLYCKSHNHNLWQKKLLSQSCGRNAGRMAECMQSQKLRSSQSIWPRGPSSAKKRVRCSVPRPTRSSLYRLQRVHGISSSTVVSDLSFLFGFQSRTRLLVSSPNPCSIFFCLRNLSWRSILHFTARLSVHCLRNSSNPYRTKEP